MRCIIILAASFALAGCEILHGPVFANNTNSPIEIRIDFSNGTRSSGFLPGMTDLWQRSTDRFPSHATVISGGNRMEFDAAFFERLLADSQVTKSVLVFDGTTFKMVSIADAHKMGIIGAKH